MWPGEIFFRSLEWSNFCSVWSLSIDGNLCNHIISPIMIYAIVLFYWFQFMRSCYFSRSKVWTPDQTVQFFYWSWVQFLDQINCFRPVWFMAYVKVWVSSQLQARIINLYHSNLHHPGVTRTLNSLSQTFEWKGMCRQAENHIKTCDACQHHKIMGKGHYGQMPLVSSLRDKDPFERVYIDCARPWTVHIENDITQELSDYKVHILTMVDAATNWPNLHSSHQQTHAVPQKCSTSVGSVDTPV